TAATRARPSTPPPRPVKLHRAPEGRCPRIRTFCRFLARRASSKSSFWPSACSRACPKATRGLGCSTRPCSAATRPCSTRCSSSSTPSLPGMGRSRELERDVREPDGALNPLARELVVHEHAPHAIVDGDDRRGHEAIEQRDVHAVAGTNTWLERQHPTAPRGCHANPPRETEPDPKLARRAQPNEMLDGAVHATRETPAGLRRFAEHVEEIG